MSAPGIYLLVFRKVLRKEDPKSAYRKDPNSAYARDRHFCSN